MATTGSKWQDMFKHWRGILAITGGALVHLTLGSLYSYGNMAPYIVSYSRLRGHTPNLTYETASLIFGAMKLGHGLSMWAGGLLERRVGVRLATFIGVAVFSASIMMSAWAITVSFYFLLFTYGLLFGIGLGIAYIPPIICAMKWMPNSKGVVNGCLLAGFGAGSLIFNFVQTGFINPGNLSPDTSIGPSGAEQLFYSQSAVLDRVPFSYVVQGIICVIMQLVGIAFLSDPPEKFKRSRRYAVRRKRREVISEKSRMLIKDNDDTEIDGKDRPSTSSTTFGEVVESHNDERMLTSGSEMEGDSEGSERQPNGRAPPEHAKLPGDHDQRWSGRTVSPVEMFREVFFWQLVAVFALDTVTNVATSTLYKAFGQTFISDDFYFAVVGAFAAVFNAGGRIFWGYIADRFSFKVSFASLSAVMAVFTLTLPLSIYGNEAMFFIWVCFLFSSMGGLFSTIPTAVSRAFGSESVGINYGIIYLLGSGIPGIITSFIQQALLTRLSWMYFFIIVGAFPAISVVISMFVYVKTPDGDDV